MTTFRAALLAAAILTPAAALARPMTPEDVARMESVGAIAVSPDGSRVAFGKNALPDITAGEKNGSTETTLYVATGPNAAQEFLPEGTDVSGIQFTPDGRMLSFLWKEEGEDAKRALYAIPLSGGSHRKIASLDDGNVGNYAWAPDSRTVYFVASAADDTQRKAESKAGFNARIYEEEQRFNRVYAYDTQGGEDAEPRLIETGSQITTIRLSPDGRTLALGSSPSTLVDDSYTKQRVILVDAATGRRRAEVATPGKIDDFEFAPDGSTMSLIAGVDINDPAPTTLHMVNTRDGTFRAVGAGAPEAVVDTEWLADGRLAAVVHVGAQSELRYYDKAGNVTGTVDAGPHILRRIKAGGNRLVAVADAPTHPGELFAVDGNRMTRWTQHNPWLSQIDMGKQRTVRYAARDGQQIEGILIEPVGGVPRGGAPTIMDVHGGPEAHESNGWNTAYGAPGQVAAGKGYAVFLPNYRGSTAYGTAFSKQHQNNYADREFNDIVDGKRYLVSQGITDADRVGITGGSYGGYATAWSTTALSDEYAAGVMFVGISNQISKFGTTDIPYEMYNVHARKWPWEDWQGMLEVSPIYHVDKADTPLLILHGEEDTRVSPSQSYELYRTIKVRKPEVPVRLVLYPGEGHGNQKAAARYDYNVRMMRWFDTYLKTGDADAKLPDARIDLPEGFTGAEKKSED